MLKRLLVFVALIAFLGFPPSIQASSKGKIHGLETIRNERPLMKITPRPDGSFLLTPLTPPPKAVPLPLSNPTRKQNNRITPPDNKHFMATPQQIARMVLDKVLHSHYAWGASLENGTGTDCSGFTRFIYRVCGIRLPHSSVAQARMGRFVTRQMDFSKLLPGDLLFFSRGEQAVGHVGIYLGDGEMVHASDYRYGVIVSNLRRPYFKRTFVVAKRFLAHMEPAPRLSMAVSDREKICSPPPPPALPRLFPTSLSGFLLKIFYPGEYHGSLTYS
jgi:cell wall-associated NlpC family hydrolase